MVLETLLRPERHEAGSCVMLDQHGTCEGGRAREHAECDDCGEVQVEIDGSMAAGDGGAQR